MAYFQNSRRTGAVKMAGCVAMLLSLTSCATSTHRAPGVTLEREGTHEQCLSLRAGERVRYSYEASDEVEFNVHYHLGDETNYPVRTSGETEASGVLSLDTAWRACFMWVNPDHPAVRVRYSLNVQDAE